MNRYSAPVAESSLDAAESAVASLWEWASQALALVVLLAVLARLLVYLPVFRHYRTTSAKPARARILGFSMLLASGVIATGAFGARRWSEGSVDLVDGLGIAVFAIVIGVLGAGILAVGFASSPVVDAKVLTPGGAANDAWAIDVLDQISSAHREGSAKAMVRARGNRADLGDAIQVADRSGYGIAALVAWLLQLFFNVAPWLVQVTVLDGLNATATLRRNGHVVEEVPLRLQVGEADDDNHRKLLIMASSFAAVRIAARYSDITGFYGVERWRSAAYANLAIQTTDDERTAYIERALAEDPANLVAEYEELLNALDDPTDAATLWTLMDRLESMIVVASSLCGARVWLLAPPEQWHESLARRVGDQRRRDPGAAYEPPQMMLRLMDWYLGSACNWVSLTTAAEGGIPPDETDDGAVLQRRHNIASVLAAFSTVLGDAAVEHRFTDRTELQRLRCLAALVDLSIGEWAQPDYGPGVAEHLEIWLDDATETTDPELRFRLACALVHEVPRRDDPEERRQLIDGIQESVGYARFSEYYRDWTFHDPELRLLGDEPALRELALSGIASAWEMERFATVVTAFPAQALGDPAWIDAEVVAAVGLTEGIGPDTLRWISDGAAILRAARAVDTAGFDDRAVLRAVRYLLDDAGYDLISLRIMGTHDLDSIVDGVAAAVYWVPDADERATAARFVDGLLAGIAPAAGGTVEPDRR